MVNSKLCYDLLIFTIITLTKINSQHVPSFWCPTATSTSPKNCHHLQIPAPFPVECDAIKVNCYHAENLLDNSTKVFVDSQRVFDSSFSNDCSNDSTTYTKTGHWRIELKRMESVYAIRIRTIGRARNQPNALKVNVSRRVSSNQTEEIECQDFEYFNGYNSYFCYPSNGALTTNYRPGFDSHLVDIFGDIYIDSCDFADIVKLYSYPITVCGKPESRDNQSFVPKTDYYLVGQHVSYTCDDDAYTLIGDVNRTCQHNGLWSGETPVCILQDHFQPQTRLLSSTGDLELYWPATNLVNATRLSENQAITYGFDTEYCISSITFEYYLELSQRTNITVYTTSVNGHQHVWTTNGSFGEYANKQHFFPSDHQQFVCCINATLQRNADKLSGSPFKRLEFINKMKMTGYPHQGPDCLRPNLLPNVKFAVDQNDTIESGMTVRLECRKGFQIKSEHSDPAEIHCAKGLWNGTIPTCQRQTSCSQPRSRKYSTWKYLENKSPHYKQVQYECDYGYQLKGRNNITCVDGKWSSPPPVCKATFCPSITVPPNLYCMLDRPNKFFDREGNGTSFHHGIGVHCYCLPGFRLIGNRTTYCYNKQWTSQLPNCQEIFCKNARFIVHSETNNSWTNIQWKIGPHNFSCPENFIIQGLEGRTFVELNCQENGEWTENQVFECVKQGVSVEKIGSIIPGVFLAIILLSFPSYLLIKQVRKTMNQRKQAKESKVNLTIPAGSYAPASDDYENSLFDDSHDVNDSLYRMDDTKNADSSESEVEVVY